MGQRPNVVREWDEDEVLGLVAFGQLEAEQMKQRTGSPHAVPVTSTRGGSTETRTVVHRVGPPPAKR